MKKLSNRGDTIIEVLVCLAVMSFVLVLTYSIVSRAQQSVRGAQERVEALKLAEGQIEFLKDIQKNQNTNFVTVAQKNNPFCINQANNSVADISNTPPNQWNANPNTDNFAAYPNGTCGMVGPGNLYNVSIISPANSAGGLFVVRIHWDRLGGGVRQEVKLEYKLYANQ